MFVILERIANDTHIYPDLHIQYVCNLSNLPVKYHSITYHDVYIMWHVLSPHKKGTIVQILTIVKKYICLKQVKPTSVNVASE